MTKIRIIECLRSICTLWLMTVGLLCVLGVIVAVISVLVIFFISPAVFCGVKIGMGLIITSALVLGGFLLSDNWLMKRGVG